MKTILLKANDIDLDKATQLLSQFKIKFNFLKNVKEFFSLFSIQKAGRGF